MVTVAGPGPAGPRHRWRVDALATLVEASAPPGPILDAGCGSASLARRLSCSGRAVYGIDLVPRWRASRSEMALTSAGSPTFARADVCAIPWPDASFAAVVMGEVLEHVPADDRAAIEATRVVAPGGVVAVSVPAGPDRLGPADKGAGHERRYDMDGLASLLRGAGLEIEMIRGWGFPTGRLYDRLCYTTGAYRGPARRCASGAGAAWLESWFRMEARFDAGNRGSGLFAVARRP